jgi:hypothetical protein
MERKDTIIHTKPDHSVGETNTLGLRPPVTYGEEVGHKVELTGTMDEMDVIEEALVALANIIRIRSGSGEHGRLLRVNRLLDELSEPSDVIYEEVPERSMGDVLIDAKKLEEFFKAQNSGSKPTE